MYIHTTTNEYPVTIASIRAAHPNTSIPAGVDLSHLGYAHVHGSAQPEGEVVEETTPTLNESDGKYYQQWTTRSFTAEELAQAKATKKADLATSRYNEEIGGFESGGNTYYSDERSQLKMLQTLSAMSSGAVTSVDWKTLDGTWVTHDATSLNAVYAAGLAFVQGLFAKEKTLGDQVDAATTKAALDAIVW